MSTDYDVHCRTCDEGLGLEDCGYHVGVADLAAMANDIAAFGKSDAYRARKCGILLTMDGVRSVSVDWFVKHAGHDIAVRNEYGAFDDRCGRFFHCGECSTSHTCQLPKDHAGKHSRSP